MQKLRERDVVGQVDGYLVRRGWRALRHNVTKVRDSYGHVTPFGERGMPDKQYLFYLPDERYFCLALVMWIEFKRPGARERCTCRPLDRQPCRFCAQAKWRREEEARGARVLRCDSFEEFCELYDHRLGWLHGSDAPRRGAQIHIQFGRGP